MPDHITALRAGLQVGEMTSGGRLPPLDFRVAKILTGVSFNSPFRRAASLMRRYAHRI